MKTKRFYTVPMYIADLAIDEATHKAFMEAHAAATEAECIEAVDRLGLTQEEAGLKHIRCSRFRNAWTELAGVLVLQKPHNGIRFVCVCRLFWPKRGQCTHELWVRFMELDPAVQIADLQGMTRGDAVQTVQGISEQQRRHNRSGRPVNVPSGSALSTMKFLKDRAIARAQEKKQKDTDNRRAVNLLFKSPSSAANAEVLEPECEARARILNGLQEQLKKSDFQSLLKAVSRLSELKVSFEEAKRYDLGALLTFISDTVSYPMPLTIAATKVLRVWVKEAKAGASVSAQSQPASAGVASSASASHVDSTSLVRPTSSNPRDCSTTLSKRLRPF